MLVVTGFTPVINTSSSARAMSNQQTNLQPSPENIYYDIDRISDWYRYIGTSGHSEAEDYIFSKFQGLGLNTSRQEYQAQRRDGSVRAVNVLGLLEGKTYPNKWFVIGGHYDASKYTLKGAYDNAVGAATVIEFANFFTEYYKDTEGPNISILFATWDAEEGGGAGSSHFVENIPDDIDIIAYINFDMYSLNYPIRNSIPGSQEEYFKLYLYTSPVSDFSSYNEADFDDFTKQNFTNFQDLLMNITYEENNYPREWVLIEDDTEANSDHKFFVRNSIPAVWCRGMHEYPKDEGDLNERNFKHTPADTLETLERYAGGKSHLLEGINTAITIFHQLTIEILNLSSSGDDFEPGIQVDEEKGLYANINQVGLLIAASVVVVVILGYYMFNRRKTLG
jgi:hypothetical protein